MKKFVTVLTVLTLSMSTLTGCASLKERIGENKKDLTAAKKQKEENEKKKAEEQQKQEQLEKERKEKLGILGDGFVRVGKDDYGYISVPKSYVAGETTKTGDVWQSEDKSHVITLFKTSVEKNQLAQDTVETEAAGDAYIKQLQAEGAQVAAGKVESDEFVNVRYIEGKFADGKVKTVFLFNEKEKTEVVHIIELQGTKDDIQKMFPVVGSWKKTKE